jgi:hypothetical protein
MGKRPAGPSALRDRPQIVAVEDDGEALNVFMRDVSVALIRPDTRLDRTSVQRILAAATELHETFWGESFPDLCGLGGPLRLAVTGHRAARAGTG